MDNQDFYDEDEKPKIIKIVLVGQSGVGKTNVILRYVQNKFNTSTSTTIGIEFSQKIVKVNNQRVTIQVWDTAGQERFRALNKTFYQNALGAILLFDLTNRDSFNQIPRWMNELREHVAQFAVFLLVGNKSDLTRNRAITVHEATAFAKEKGVGYIEASAALGNNISEAFELLTSKIIQKISQMKQSSKTKTFKTTSKLSKKSLSSVESNKKKDKGCC